MKILLVILDGLADRPIKELNFSTPLHSAKTPNLDKLATIGANGLMYPISPGIAPSTDLAHFVLLGYSPKEYPGRAAVEALGEERPMRDEQVVLRTSFISVEEKEGVFYIRGRDVPVTEEELDSLTEVVESTEIEGIRINFLHSGKRQGFLFMEGADSFICDSDPFDLNVPVVAVQSLKEAVDKEKAARTADALNDFLLQTHNRLEDHPANHARRKRGLLPLNFLVSKWASRPARLSTLDSFSEKYALKGAATTAGVLLKGLSKAIGLDFFPVEEVDGPGGSLEKRCSKALELFGAGYDFVLAHSKAADEAAHTKNPAAKRQVIEELDWALAPLLEEQFLDGNLLIVTADHSTPSVGTLIHSGEPVPLLFAGSSIRADDVERFDEFSCQKGSLGFIRGRDLMPLILNYTDRSKYLGSRSFATDYPARPHHRKGRPA
jgi:2,3-bisphosphoglycerate-independent phosphoglycerate mutase